MTSPADDRPGTHPDDGGAQPDDSTTGGSGVTGALAAASADRDESTESDPLGPLNAITTDDEAG